ncbi:MAG TPA: hypothetical protein VFS57_08835 [Gemmatimonadaceae bacterium]|nr:hypothetical protein [Gemmatimonadaceae bacterium]
MNRVNWQTERIGRMQASGSLASGVPDATRVRALAVVVKELGQ